MAEWFESFFEGLYSLVLADQRFEGRTTKEAHIIKRLLRLRKGQHVLDIPSGLGRISLPLARAGIRVTGVDMCRPYIRRARKRAKAEGLNITFIEADMRNINFDGEFEAAYNWFGSFGYSSDADDVTFVRQVYKALKPGGRFLINDLNKSWFFGLSHLSRGTETRAGVSITVRYKRNRATNRVHYYWTLSKGGTTETHHVVHRLYSGGEIRSLLQQVGFRDIKLYGNPPVGRFTRHSREFIAVARRPLL